MNRLATIKFEPLTFSTIDFKYLYLVVGDQDDEIKESVFTIMRGMFLSSYKTYQICTSPNVDKERIAKIVVDAIAPMKQAIPGCSELFEKISNSARLYENNFDSYYKDFLQSGDQTTLLSSFLTDVVSDNKKTDFKLLIQCRKVIAYIRERIRPNKSNKTNNLILKYYDKIDSVISRSYFQQDGKNEEQDNGDEGDKNDEGEDDAELPDIDDLMRQIEDPKVSHIKK
jgi:hypothetical protein